MTDEEIIAVVTAHKEGKMIEYCYKAEGNGIWSNCPLSICWNFGVFNYRIKPEPHYRPFESAEEVMEAIKEHGSWVKFTYATEQIISVNSGKVVFGGGMNWIFGKTLPDNTQWLDGTPFGKLEE